MGVFLLDTGIRRVFYDKITGNILQEIGRNGSFTLPTIEEDIKTYTTLSERNRDTFDVIELPFGNYSQDFTESNGYQVDVDTKELEFSYPDPNAPEVPQVFQKALTEQIAELNAKLATTQEAIDFLIMGGM